MHFHAGSKRPWCLVIVPLWVLSGMYLGMFSLLHFNTAADALERLLRLPLSFFRSYLWKSGGLSFPLHLSLVLIVINRSYFVCLKNIFHNDLIFHI